MKPRVFLQCTRENNPSKRGGHALAGLHHWRDDPNMNDGAGHRQGRKQGEGAGIGCTIAAAPIRAVVGRQQQLYQRGARCTRAQIWPRSPPGRRRALAGPQIEARASWKLGARSNHTRQASSPSNYPSSGQFGLGLWRRSHTAGVNSSPLMLASPLPRTQRTANSTSLYKSFQMGHGISAVLIPRAP